MTTLQNRAMLVNMTIHQWTARKADKKVSKQVESQHGAVDAGKYHKLLVDKKLLDPISKAAGQLRDYHYDKTLPWGDNGDRLLPSSLFMTYTQDMRKLKEAFQDQVLNFTRAYPNEVSAARARLGTMYDPADYPAHIGDRFGVDTTFLPIADAEDFRVEVGEETLAEIRADISNKINARQAQAVQACYSRLLDCVVKIKDVMEKEDPIFRDSLIENLQELLLIMPALNITEDKKLTEICKDIEESLVTSPARLRNDGRLRHHLFLDALRIESAIKEHL